MFGIAHRKAIGAVGVLAAAGLASTGVAIAHGGGGGGEMVLHGQFVVASGDGTQTHDVQYGTVKKISKHAIRVRSKDGFVQGYAITRATMIRANCTGPRTADPSNAAADGHYGNSGSIQKGDKVDVLALERNDRAPKALAIKDFGNPHQMQPLHH